MDAKLKADWVAALRSGTYRQAVGCFDNGGAHCALGLLCVVAGEPATSNGGISGNWGFVRKALDDMTMKTIYRLNDSGGRSFAQIADFIEANIPAEHKTNISVFTDMLQAPLVEHQSAVDANTIG
jgi:hypothetical protein